MTYENEDGLSESERNEGNSRFKLVLIICSVIMICIYGGLYLMFR